MKNDKKFIKQKMKNTLSLTTLKSNNDKREKSYQEIGLKKRAISEVPIMK